MWRCNLWKDREESKANSEWKLLVQVIERKWRHVWRVRALALTGNSWSGDEVRISGVHLWGAVTWLWCSSNGEPLNRVVNSNGGGGGGGGPVVVTSQTCLVVRRSVLSLWHRSSAFLSLRLRTLMFSTHSANSSLLKTLFVSSLLDTMLVNSWKGVNYKIENVC